MSIDISHRLSLKDLAPDVYRAMSRFAAEADKTGLDPQLVLLLHVRASQINGCAYCIDMHTKDARKLGETEQRLYALNAWRETPFFSDRERAALALTEAITLIADGQVPDDVYDDAAREFDEAELAALILSVTVINAWNRIAISSRMEPGRYEP